MTRAIWITGRAATGKSTLIRELTVRFEAAGLSPSVVNDEEILLDLIRADVEHHHHTHPHGDHRISFTDGHLFDQGVIELGHRVQEHLSTGTGNAPVIVELARGCSAPIDVSYQRALDLIDPRLWAHSRVYRLDVPWPVQTTRNDQRLHDSGKGPDLAILRQLYRRDDSSPFTAAGITVTALPPANPAYLAQQVFLEHTRELGRRPENPSCGARRGAYH